MVWEGRFGNRCRRKRDGTPFGGGAGEERDSLSTRNFGYGCLERDVWEIRSNLGAQNLTIHLVEIFSPSCQIKFSPARLGGFQAHGLRNDLLLLPFILCPRTWSKQLSYTSKLIIDQRNHRIHPSIIIQQAKDKAGPNYWQNPGSRVPPPAFFSCSPGTRRKSRR